MNLNVRLLKKGCLPDHTLGVLHLTMLFNASRTFQPDYACRFVERQYRSKRLDPKSKHLWNNAPTTLFIIRRQTHELCFFGRPI
jgi:hypothetical protein